MDINTRNDLEKANEQIMNLEYSLLCLKNNLIPGNEKRYLSIATEYIQQIKETRKKIDYFLLKENL